MIPLLLGYPNVNYGIAKKRGAIRPNGAPHANKIVYHACTNKPLKACDLTFDTPEENLACDEVLLELCEAGSLGGVLRFWEPSSHFVVIGYANRASVEVDLEFCRRHEISVLRRCSGGEPCCKAQAA